MTPILSHTALRCHKITGCSIRCRRCWSAVVLEQRYPQGRGRASLWSLWSGEKVRVPGVHLRPTRGVIYVVGVLVAMDMDMASVWALPRGQGFLVGGSTFRVCFRFSVLRRSGNSLLPNSRTFSRICFETANFTKRGGGFAGINYEYLTRAWYPCRRFPSFHPPRCCSIVSSVQLKAAPFLLPH